MSKIVKIIISMIAIIAIISVGAYVVYDRETTVSSVQGFEMSENSVSSISLSWKPVERVDGYNIYAYNQKTKEYKLLKKVQETKYDIDKIDCFSVYSLKISAYRMFLGKEYNSPKSKAVTVYSIPLTPKLSVSSKQVGVMTMSWNRQENISGFELQYSRDKTFEKKESVETNELSYKKEGLKQGEEYFVRCRAYGLVGDERIFSDWSEASNTKIKKANPKKPTISKSIDKNKPMVALSFDDGPAYKEGKTNSTERILDVLEKYNARATFFMVAQRITDSNKYLLEREIRLGCEIGNHTYSHNHYGTQVTAADISRAGKRIHKYCRVYPTIFRCPGGSITPLIRKECKKEGLPIAYWTVDTEDWKSRNAKSVAKIATTQCYDGCIILMHDIYDSTADAVEVIVPKLIKQGYQIVTVSELLTVKGEKGLEPGVQYMDYKTVNNNTR